MIGLDLVGRLERFDSGEARALTVYVDLACLRRFGGLAAMPASL